MKRVFFVFAGLTAGVVAQATTLTLSLTADDYADAYISTSPTVQGVQFMNKTTLWGATDTKTVTLTPNVKQYLHIRARDVFGAPSMLLAEATLSDGLFEFGNATQNLLTNTTDWKLSLTGWDTNYVTIQDLGSNGTTIWGTRPGISLNARYIWSSTSQGEHYFSTEITPVPEPATLFALGAGLLGLARRRRTR